MEHTKELLWKALLEELQQELSAQSFSTWVLPMEPVELKDHTLVVKVPTKFHWDHFHTRYGSKAEVILRKLSEDGELSLAVITSEGEGVPVQQRINFVNLPHRPFQQTRLSSRYIFENFVVGKSNNFAYAASKAVAEAPGKAYNPLFIYGGVGLGKTHLLHAIGNYVVEQNSELKVLYVSCEEFMNEMIQAISQSKMIGFREKYREIDLLLVDDIQFLKGKEATQEEFFHTFNAIYDTGKQVVATSDSRPNQIAVEERLRSRFEMGLVADIVPPDYELKVAILERKSEASNIKLPSDVARFIASKSGQNVRELEGYLKRIFAFCSVNKCLINLDSAKEALKDAFPVSNKEITIEGIQDVVAQFFKIKTAELKAKKRTATLAFQRQIAMYLCKEFTESSLVEIGQHFGGRDHATVIHSCEKIKEEFKTNANLQEKIKYLKEKIFEKSGITRSVDNIST